MLILKEREVSNVLVIGVSGWKEVLRHILDPTGHFVLSRAGVAVFRLFRVSPFACPETVSGSC